MEQPDFLSSIQTMIMRAVVHGDRVPAEAISVDPDGTLFLHVGGRTCRLTLSEEPQEPASEPLPMGDLTDGDREVSAATKAQERIKQIDETIRSLNPYDPNRSELYALLEERDVLTEERSE